MSKVHLKLITIFMFEIKLSIKKYQITDYICDYKHC